MWSWSEVPFNNWLHRTNPILFFISLDRRSDAKINHQINISSNTTFAWTLRKIFIWCEIMYETSVVWCGAGWLTDRLETTGCAFNTPLALPAYLTACSHEETTWTHTSTAVTALPAVSANRVWDWSCVTLFPLCTPTQPLILACSIKI